MLIEIWTTFGECAVSLIDKFGFFGVILTTAGAISLWWAMTWTIGTCIKALFSKKES